MGAGQGNGEDEESTKARWGNEIALLQAMYPEQIEWNSRRSELKFICQTGTGTETTSSTAALLVVRLSDDYLTENGSLPTIISAQSSTKQDLRDAMTQILKNAGIARGQEVLDQIVITFENLATTEAEHITNSVDRDVQHTPFDSRDSSQVIGDKVVVVWLHHLLATGKRKLALHPNRNHHGSVTVPQISGLTKPGYPGIMVFSGSRDCVESHVADLKNQRWQAFQIRYEDTFAAGQGWTFEHGAGIKEVENMSDVVSGIQKAEHRSAFLTAAGVK